MSLKKFLISRVFFKNLGLAIAIAAAMLLVTLIWLSIFTRHGQARPVPDFYGLTIEDAGNLARKKRVKINVIDSVYTTVGCPCGCVVEQHPVAGSYRKKQACGTYYQCI
ncbi:MAG: PASTA domain-containing protein [Bacteroidales bacterium]